MTSEIQMVDDLARALTDRGVKTPQVVFVLGSGLNPVEKMLSGALEIPYADLPGVVAPAVAGHSGKVLFGSVKGVDLIMLCGRTHLYEGHSPAEVVRLLRATIKLGTKVAVVTNAAGGVNPDFKPGDLMVIRDHLNLQGVNPFLGPEDFGPRFPDQSSVYADAVSKVLLEVDAPGVTRHQGVYLANLGPLYETPAEVRMAAVLGADAVGMSTVQEAAAAFAMGVLVGGISVIANPAAGISTIALDHRDVVEQVNLSATGLANLLTNALPKLAELSPPN